MRSCRSFIQKVIFLFFVAAAACAQSPTDSSLLETAYTNHFFGFRYDISPSWTPQTEAAKQKFTELRRVRLNPNLDVPGSALDASGKKVFYNLLTLTRPIPASDGRSNRAVMGLLAEDVSFDPALASGKDVVLKLAGRLTAFHYVPAKDAVEIQIGGRTFFRQDLKQTASGSGAPHETLVFSVVRRYALGFVLIAPNQQVLESMVSGLNKLEFLRPAE